jgi:hypothetical protein
MQLSSESEEGCNRNFQRRAFRVDTEADIAAELAQRCPNLVGEERHCAKRVFEFGRSNADSTPEQVELASAHAPVHARPNRRSFGDWEKDERHHPAATAAEALAQTEEEKD